MSRDDIIRMAREAGWPASVLHPHGLGVDTSEYLLVPTLERFASLIAAAEREECAKVIEKYCGAWNDEGFALASAVRARSNT